MINNDDIRKTHEELEKLKTGAEERLLKAPEGSLKLSFQRGKYRYYYCDEANQKKYMYLNRKQEDLIRRLAQKKYDEYFIKAISNQLQATKKIEEIYDSDEPYNVLQKLPYEYSNLIKPVLLSDEEYIKNWYEEKHREMELIKNKYDIEGSIISKRGEPVRSKSEKIIADLLAEHNIPYVYECPLLLEDSYVFPDFTVLNVRERREKYYEHFGMMDDANYVARTIRKIEEYEHAGIWPGEKLLMSFETSRTSFDMRLIEDNIRLFLT